MLAGDIPTRYRNIFAGRMIELTKNMSDAQIIHILEMALSNKGELLKQTAELHELICDNFSYKNGSDQFKKIVNAIDNS